MKKVNELGRKVFHYRMAGDDIYDIADRLGVTIPIAMRAFREYANVVARDGDPEDRRAAVELEVTRLDTLMQAWWQDATVGGDVRAAKIVLDTIVTRAKLQQLDKADVSDPQILQQVLIVGQNQAEFIKALQEGRALGRGPDDNEIVEGTVEQELTL